MVHIVGAATGGATLAVPISEWRSLNTAVEKSIADSFVSYDEAAAKLGIHRSTLNDWIAQGKLARVLIGGRGFITAASISSVDIARTKRSGRQLREVEPARFTLKSADSPNSVITAEPSRDALSIIRVLANRSNAMTPGEFSVNLSKARQPGMYAWWGDDEARDLLGSQLGANLPHLFYVGQAGATKRRSRLTSNATLASRVGSQHIRGNARSSTFRLTISSLLIEPLGLIMAGDRKLAPASNRRVSAWIAEHLRVAIAPCDDRDRLAEIEQEVVAHLNPPLNLEHCPPSESRARLRQRRALLSN